MVRLGERVHAGQLIGYEGRTGRASGCHVHYSLFSPLEPATFGLEASLAERLRLPPTEIARVDPMLVLPVRAVDLRYRHGLRPLSVASATE